MLKCLIIDDEEMSSTLLEKYCHKIESIHQVESCNSAINAIKKIQDNNYDFLLLDIEMPDMSGMDLLRNFRNLPPVILTTSKTEFAVESYEYDVIDYLTKPVEFARLLKAVKRIESKLSPSHKVETKTAEDDSSIYIKTSGKYVQLELSEILYVATMDDYLIFHLQDGKKHIVHSTLSNMDKKLPDSSFLKIHRSYIVNLKKIDVIEDTHLEIDKKVIPISRSKRPILMERINPL